MAVGAVASAINPITGATYFGMSSTYDYYLDAKERGMNEEDAQRYGAVMAGMEGVTEGLSWGNFIKAGKGIKTLIKGTGKEITKNTGKEVAKTGIKEVLKDYGIGIGENFIQEAVMEPISEATATVVGGKDTANWNEIGSRMLQSGINGALTSAIVGGANMGIQSCVAIEEKMNNGKTPTQEEIKLAVEEASKHIDVEAIIKERIQGAIKEAENNSLPMNRNNQKILPTQEIIQNQNKIAQNGNMEQNQILKENYSYEKSDNTKIDNLRQDASRYWDNSEKTQSLMNTIEKVISDKDYNIRLDNNITNEKGQSVNAQIKTLENGEVEIKINPNSQNVGEFLLAHEITHAIETDEMKSLIMDYASKNSDFNEAVKGLKERYGTDDISSEVIADISGQYLGNQEFINNLSMEKPNVFKRIYNKIIELANKITGNTKESLFIKDLKNKWEEAYRTQSNNSGKGIEYSIGGQKGINNAKMKDPSYSIAQYYYNKAQEMANQNIDNEIIRQQTNWFRDKNGDWKFEFSDKDMSLKNIKFQEGKTYKLGDILEHDTLFTLYPELANYDVIFENRKSGGAFKKSENLIKINSNKINSRISTQGTLIHEIQHAIQNIEGFESGASSKFKENYYKSLGEIEANDTKRRYLLEKQGKLDRNNIIPESSKSNPQHPNLNNYLKNRNILDKIKDSIYNYFNSENNSKGGKYNDYQEDIEENQRQDLDLVDVGRRGRHVDENYEINKNAKTSNTQYSLPTKNWNVQNNIEIQNGEAKYIDENNNANDIYFRLDEEGGFKGKEHQSAISMWEDRIDDLLTPDFIKNDSFDIDMPDVEEIIQRDYDKIDNILQKYGTSYEEYEDMEYEKQLEIKRKIALDKGDMTYGASVYDLTEDGLDFFKDYHGDHTDGYPEVNFFTGETNGFGADGEHVVIPDKELLKINSSELLNIVDDIDYSDEFEDATEHEKSVELLKRITDLINNKRTNKTLYSKKATGEWQEHLDKYYKSTGTRTNLEDIRLPLKDANQNNTSIQEKKSAPYRTAEQIAKDKNISDLDAIREESEKVNLPTMEMVKQKEKELNKIDVDKSPTIDYIKKKRSKEKASLEEIKDVLAQTFVNKGHYIDKLANQTKNKRLTWLYDRTMTTFNEAQISIGDNQVDSNGNVVGKSIIDIFKPAEELQISNQFNDYLLNKHNISRKAHEKGIFGDEISATDSKKIIEKYEAKYPEFKKWSKEVSKYNDNNLKDMANNGLISQEMYKKLREMYPDYVPTFRDITDNIQQYIDDNVGNNPLGKATQSNKSILSVSESMAEQTLAIKKATRINNLGIELYNTIGKGKETIQGLQFDAQAIVSLQGDVIEKATDGTNTFTIFQDGEMTTFKISDELYSAFKKDTLQNKINNNKVAKTLLTPVEKLSKAQREILTTYSIGFAFNNPIKDFQDALFNTKYNTDRFMKNWTKALYNIATSGSWYESYKNNGGTANTYFDYNKGILPTNSKNPVKIFTDKIRHVNEVLEQAPRLAEYISTIENGGSIDEALYNSAEITTNFKRGGDITKVANKYGANFLNASVQGLDKFYRNLSGKNGWKGYANILTKATLYQVAPAIINALLLGDDEDYEDLPEYTKDNYYLFKIGNGKFFRIPKGRVSSMIGGISRRALETAQGKNVDWSSIVNTTINQMAPNNPFSDNLIATIKQAIKNETWYGGEIVSSRLQKLPSAEQYDESTDRISKFLGEKLNISPKKINYVLDQYSGGIGDVLLPMMTPQAENNILEDKFTTDVIMKNKNVSNYYSKLEELEKNNNSINATDSDKLKYKYMSENSSDLSNLYKEKRNIQNSNLSDNEKKKQAREIQKQINNIVEEKLEKVDTLKVNHTTATVGDSKYYKYKGEWKKLTDKEAEKSKGISLNTYSDYQNKIADLASSKKDDGENITINDKIELLLNSKYSNTEKDKIYTQLISTKDTIYTAVKAISKNSNNKSIDEYLKYKTQKFTSDKKEDGTLNGKSVSRSKKTKVFDYINNNISDYNTRLLLAGLQGKLSQASQRRDLFNAINDTNELTQKEKLKLFNSLNGFTVYKNGTVTY